jgi:hypothetical protein
MNTIVSSLIRQIDKVIQKYKQKSDKLKKELKTANKNEILIISKQIEELNTHSQEKVLKLCEMAYNQAQKNKQANDEKEILKIKNNLLKNVPK